MQDKDVMALVIRTRAPEAPYRADAVAQLSRLVLDDVHRRVPQVRAALLAALRDPDARVRRRIAWLVTAGPRRRVYLTLPRDRWPMDPRLVTRVVGIDPNVDIFDDRDFLTVLDDPDSRVRVHAADVLAVAGDLRVVPALVTMLGDRFVEMRSHAADSIGVLLSRMPDDRRSEAVERVLGPLTAATRDSEETVRCLAAWALGETRDPQAGPALSAMVLSGSQTGIVRESLAKIGQRAPEDHSY